LICFFLASAKFLVLAISPFLVAVSCFILATVSAVKLSALFCVAFNASFCDLIALEAASCAVGVTSVFPVESGVPLEAGAQFRIVHPGVLTSHVGDVTVEAGLILPP